VVKCIFPPLYEITDSAEIVQLVSEHKVTSQQSLSLHCQADGNPNPTYSWTPCDPQQSVCNESVLDFEASNESIYTFTCKVENFLGSDTRITTICKLAIAKLCVFTCTMLALLYFVTIINLRKNNVEYTAGSCNLLHVCTIVHAVITVTSF